MAVKHLHYAIDEKADRFLYYETLWKRKGLALLLKHCQPQGKSLLDYGSGRGEFLEFAAHAGFKAEGADVDPECVKLSARYGPACQLNAQDPLAQFGNKSFDVVSCFHVLEHVENPKQILGAIAKIARQYVVVAVPNLRYLSRLFKRKIELSGVNEGHLQSWDHWHFLNLAQNHCGLELVEWGSDATVLQFFNGIGHKIMGTKALIWLETGIFRSMFPYHGVSVLGLFRPRRG
jgi:SAM-dependent methyltransferase